ncbi:RNA pyrophosphohydrolase [Candidatus Pantoea edessiphila]|uniref:RNA pyrophosphohydrolase n=1 Tax=Candidatus Pantoea edessiphila TaxID=2044610 RepID=A0A2P5SVP5_9GAMM|nr:RNA pyrophosphohydrolase [Candidatus Pantoea edessiphila]PPI86403.1 RNA pyrophosphohydrolase [Candidatus Pantoea edessiphila]
MIDDYGYRLNVGFIICNMQKKLLWAKRSKQKFWQFPQGGVNYGETIKKAMYRELFEEIGLYRQDVRILAHNDNWLSYKLPKKLIRYDVEPLCIGQKQQWFLLQLLTDESNIDINCSKLPEFDDWKWVNFWYPLSHIVSFKREVYRIVMNNFFHIMELVK